MTLGEDDLFTATVSDGRTVRPTFNGGRRRKRLHGMLRN